jgi:phosphatidylglycerophosphate synthase
MGYLNTSPFCRVIPHALTAVRLVLVFPFALFMAREDKHSALFAGIAITVAIVTDFLDGYVARIKGVASTAGRTFDHIVDFLFVTSGLFSGALRGVFSWILPVLITAAFAQYLIDSYWVHRLRGLRGNLLGRVNGILYFVPLCTDILIRLGLNFLQPLLRILVWALVLSTLVSMGQRLTIKTPS